MRMWWHDYDPDDDCTCCPAKASEAPKAPVKPAVDEQTEEHWRKVWEKEV